MYNREDDSKCIVHGVLAMTLRVSSVSGFAPVRMTRATGRFGGWCVRVDPSLLLYGKVLLFIIVAAFTCCGIFDNVDYVVTETVMRYSLLLEVVQLLSLAAFGVFGVQARIEAIFRSLHIVEKIQSEYNIKRWLKTIDRRGNVLLMITLLYFLLCFGKCMHIVYNYILGVGPIGKVFLYACNIFVFGWTVLLAAQFVFAALRVNCALKALVHSINGLICIIDLQSVSNLSCMTPGWPDNNIIPAKSISFTVDTMSLKKSSSQKNNEIRVKMDVVRSIDRLTATHAQVIEAIGELNAVFQLPMTIIFASFLMSMTFTPYFFVTAIVKRMEGTLSTIMFVNIIMHLTYMLLCVQPGHEIEQETLNMRQLLSELTSRASSCSAAVGLRVRMLHTQLQLDTHTYNYTLIGVAALTRPLIPAILATTTTFIVLLLQFKSI